MNGMAMMLKSFGINIDPDEIMRSFEHGRELLPQIAEQVMEMRASQIRTENMVQMICLHLNLNPIGEIKNE